MALDFVKSASNGSTVTNTQRDDAGAGFAATSQNAQLQTTMYTSNTKIEVNLALKNVLPTEPEELLIKFIKQNNRLLPEEEAILAKDKEFFKEYVKCGVNFNNFKEELNLDIPIERKMFDIIIEDTELSCRYTINILKRALNSKDQYDKALMKSIRKSIKWHSIYASQIVRDILHRDLDPTIPFEKYLIQKLPESGEWSDYYSNCIAERPLDPENPQELKMLEAIARSHKKEAYIVNHIINKIFPEYPKPEVYFYKIVHEKFLPSVYENAAGTHPTSGTDINTGANIGKALANARNAAEQFFAGKTAEQVLSDSKIYMTGKYDTETHLMHGTKRVSDPSYINHINTNMNLKILGVISR